MEKNIIKKKEELSLSYTAQMIMDLYYKDFKSEEEFFELEHFIFCARSLYTKIVNASSKEARQMDKAETGYYTITLSSDLLIEETVKLEVKSTNEKMSVLIGSLSQEPISFPYDNRSFGIQNVSGEDMMDSYVRLSQEQLPQFKHLPSTDNKYFFAVGNVLRVVSSQSDCKIKSCVVTYAPSLIGDPDSVFLPPGVQFDIVSMGAKMMLELTKNIVIDKTVDQNPNKVIETEIAKMN